MFTQSLRATARFKPFAGHCRASSWRITAFGSSAARLHNLGRTVNLCRLSSASSSCSPSESCLGRCVTALEVAARPVSSHGLRSTQNASAWLRNLDTVMCGGRRFETVVEVKQHTMFVAGKAVEEWYALSERRLADAKIVLAHAHVETSLHLRVMS